MRPVTVSQVGTGTSDAVVLDYRLQNGVRLAVETSGTVNYTVEDTNDDVFNVASSSLVWVPYPGTQFVSATTTAEGSYQQTPTAVHVKVNSGAGTAKLIVIPQGRIG